MDIVTEFLNRGLPRSMRARELVRELAGKRVGVEVTGFGRWAFESTGESLKVTRDDASTDALLVGGPFSLIALTSDAPEAVLQRGDVQIQGDAELAQRFAELMKLLKPDLEEELSTVIGDVPAYQIGRLARTATNFTRRATGTTLRNLAEYFAHERRDVVPRTEAESFFRGVDVLREDVDRLEARINLLMGPHS